MIRGMSVRVVTGRELKGPACAKAYPEKADDLWVFAIADGRRRAKRVGPPTDENRSLAERKRHEWEILIERSALGESKLIAPLFKEAVNDFARHGLSHRAWRTRRAREYQLGVMEREWGDIAIDGIDTGMVTQLGQAMLKSGKSIRTVNGYMDALSLLYQHHANSMPSLENPSVAARKALSPSAVPVSRR